MSTSHHTANRTPKLRFGNFNDQWMISSFGDSFERITQKNIENNQNILTISAQQGLISQDKFFTKIVAARDVRNYYLLHKNDFAYNKSYSKGYPMGAIKRLAKDNKGVVSTLYICFRSKDVRSIEFYEQYFAAGKLNAEIEKIAQEGARNHGLLNMSVVDFFKMQIIAPSLNEQEKIAEFLVAVDEKINLMQQKLDLLKQYKIGLMQELFTQKIRFKKEDSTDYSAWQERSLKDVFTEVSSSVGAEDIETYSISAGRGFVSQKEKFGKDISGAQNKNYSVLDNDDFSYNKGNSKSYKYGCIYVNRLGKKIAVPKVFISFRLKDNSMSSIFFEKLFENHYLDRSLRKIISSSARMDVLLNVNKDYFFNLKIVVPSIEEQHKIASALSAVDEIISIQENNVDQANKYKKALLQQMFVK